MKRNLSLIIFQLATAFTILFFNGCSKDSNPRKTETYVIYSNPVYESKSEALASINGSPATPIQHAGKVYIKDNFIYLNDVNRGIHIFDNSNPAHPTQVAFLAIPGNLDIAVKNNILYADMYDELLALDISNPHNAKLADTVPSFFTGRAYIGNFPANLDNKIMVDWTEKDTSVTIDNILYTGTCDDCMIETLSNSPGSKSGTAGSMAGMVLMNNYLYAISEMHSLGIIDVSNAAHPKLDSSFFAGFDLETVYPFQNKLFLGSAIGTFMFDVSNPAQPVSIGQFVHGTACDPVIADGNYAYITLRSGTMCGGAQNELDVVSIKDIANSSLLKTYNLKNPTGLGKDGNWLFVCDDNKVNVYNASDPSGLVLLEQITSNKPYDVIAANKKLVVVDADGISQYDYSNISHINRLSIIEAKQ